MGDNLGLLGSFSGDGGGVPSDGSTTGGSILTSKNNQEMGFFMSAEVSSSFSLVNHDDDDDDDENLELGLGLSIGLKSEKSVGYCGQYARILTAEDLSSFSVKNPNLTTFGAKLSSDSVTPSSMVGWPPIRKGHRLANKTKAQDEQSSLTHEPNKTIKSKLCSETRKGVSNNGYLLVKVNMDGTLIGRKVDLNAHNSYATLAQTLEDMFCQSLSNTETAGSPKLLDATSEFVLTYEDKDGDCMLVGDVPWQMFLSSVKRLRIMRNSESNNFASNKRTVATPTCQEKNTRRRVNDV